MGLVWSDDNSCWKYAPRIFPQILLRFPRSEEEVLLPAHLMTSRDFNLHFLLPTDDITSLHIPFLQCVAQQWYRVIPYFQLDFLGPHIVYPHYTWAYLFTAAGLFPSGMEHNDNVEGIKREGRKEETLSTYFQEE